MPEKNKSLLKLRQEKLERVAMRKQAKLEYATLPDFIRFVDYMAVEVLVNTAVSTTNNFYEELCKIRKNGVFETTIRFNEKGSYFSPHCSELQELLDRLVGIMVNTVGSLNRVVYINNKSATNNGASIQHMIRSDRKFKETCELIKERIANDFDRAEEHAHSFDNVRPIFDFNATWDYEAYKKESHDMSELNVRDDR